MSYDLRTIRQEFRSKGVYHTPRELAALLRSHAPAMPRQVYDPTCGVGSLLSVFPDAVAKYGQEVDPAQLRIATTNLKNFTGHAGDTLKEPAFLGMAFDCIVANPPFSVSWEPVEDERFAAAPTIPTRSRADFAFLLHILHYLAPEGTAVVLCFPGVLYRRGREGTIRQWMVERGYIEKVIHIPGNTFVDTSVATALLVMRKQRAGRDIEFIDTERGESATATEAEVRANDFVLSPSTYISVEPERTEVDSVALEHQARRQMLRKLKADIEVSRLVCQMEGMDFNRYLDELESVVREARSAPGAACGAANRLAQSVLPLAQPDAERGR